jgi:hypothetical protein
MAGLYGKKRDKKYRPKPKSAFGGLKTIIDRRVSEAPLTDERQTNVVLSYHTSIQAMRGGFAQQCHFDTIVYALNIGVILAENGIGEEYLTMLGSAMNAMRRCKDRYLKIGKFGLDGDGLKALEAVADVHQAQMEVATQGELKAAIDEMYRRIEENKRRAA